MGTRPNQNGHVFTTIYINASAEKTILHYYFYCNHYYFHYCYYCS